MKFVLPLKLPNIATKKIKPAVKTEKDENSKVRLETIFEFALTLYRSEFSAITNQTKRTYAKVTGAL